jgi:hypothetical protein
MNGLRQAREPEPRASPQRRPLHDSGPVASRPLGLCARCPRCHLDCWVDLDTVARLSGSQVTLWNRWARCRRYGCPGRMAFLFTPPGEPRGVFWPLHDPPEKRMPATGDDIPGL